MKRTRFWFRLAYFFLAVVSVVAALVVSSVFDLEGHSALLNGVLWGFAAGVAIKNFIAEIM